MSKNITHIIFDMDGLILDTEVLYERAINNVTKSFGYEYTFELKMKVMGRTNEESAKVIIDYLSLPLTVEQYTQRIDDEHVKVFSNYIDLLPGAERLIRHLHSKNIPIAIATSSRKSTFDLKTKYHQDLFNLFNHIVIASEDAEISKGKPDPQTFIVCASRFKHPPKEMSNILVFEDSPNGVQAANAAGMTSIWVPELRMPRDIVKPYLILNSLEEFQPEQFGLPPYDNN